MPGVKLIGIGALALGLAVAVGTSFTAVAQVEDATMALGRQVFVEIATPACAICHTLADAEAAGTIGPNLDTLMPSLAQVTAALTDGVGIMPSFAGSLTPEQLEAVATYVSTVTGGNTP